MLLKGVLCSMLFEMKIQKPLVGKDILVMSPVRDDVICTKGVISLHVNILQKIIPLLPTGKRYASLYVVYAEHIFYHWHIPMCISTHHSTQHFSIFWLSINNVLVLMLILVSCFCAVREGTPLEDVFIRSGSLLYWLLCTSIKLRGWTYCGPSICYYDVG